MPRGRPTVGGLQPTGGREREGRRADKALDFKLAGRVTLADKAVVLEDLAVAYLGRDCHLFGTFRDLAGQRYHGISTDGRKFRRLDNLLVNDLGTEGSAAASGDGLRFYGTSGRASFRPYPATQRSGRVSRASACRRRRPGRAAPERRLLADGLREESAGRSR